MAEQKQTTDHKAIESFAREHQLKPARVKGTGGSSDPGMIRLMQPSSPQSESENLEEISWDDWFDAFEKNNLALIRETGNGNNFNKLVSRN